MEVNDLKGDRRPGKEGKDEGSDPKTEVKETRVVVELGSGYKIELSA